MNNLVIASQYKLCNNITKNTHFKTNYLIQKIVNLLVLLGNLQSALIYLKYELTLQFLTCKLKYMIKQADNAS